MTKLMIEIVSFTTLFKLNWTVLATTLNLAEFMIIVFFCVMFVHVLS